jgi:putative MATE family efflux protein
MKKNSRIQLMTEGNVTVSLLKLGIPMVVSMLVIALYNVVDTYFVSALGKTQVGATTVAFPISLIFTGIGLTFGTGGGSYISRLLGAKEHDKANNVASVALFSSLLIGSILVVVILLFLTPVLKFMGATDTILPYARSYGFIFVISMIFSTINVATGNIVISQGASNITLTAMIIGSVLNMILDPIFIYTLHLNIVGAAIATLLSQVITTLIYLWFFISDRSFIKIKLSNFKPTKEIYIQIIKIGVSMLLLQIFSSLSMSLLVKSAGLYGDDEAVAAIGIVLRVITLGTNVIFGFMKGLQPMAGFNYGSKNYTRLKEATISSVKWTTVFGIVWTVIIIILAKPIMSLFSDDPNIIELGKNALWANTIMFFTFGFQFTFSTLYLAFGKAISGVFLSTFRQGIFFIPVIVIMPKILGITGVIYSQAIADLLTTIVTIFFAVNIKKVAYIE